MRPALHGVGAAGLGLVVFWQTDNALWSLMSAAGSLFPDVDHLIESWFRCRGRWSLRAFLKPDHFDAWPRLVFMLHGYEWLVLLLALAVGLESGSLFHFTLGYLSHLLLDEAGNRMPGVRHRIRPLFYFLSYRLWHGFNLRIIAPERLDL
ncbi:MAG: hypothetical protein HQM00_02785 [Magnetococcales bacterium]|nr:hypothetical protein [Magnetococcales bacterium]